MKVLISGSSGLVGTALRDALSAEGHRIVRLVRDADVEDGDEAEKVFWDPSAGELDAARLAGVDAVVHLAGENIAASRWNEEVKARIYSSRVDGTRLLVRKLAELEAPPAVMVSASAIGYYGDRGDQVVDEESAPGQGFLAEVCRAWEAAARPVEDLGVRLVLLRTGVVLSPAGGALQRMLPPFKLGLGGPVGDGEQYVSWIALPDLVRIIQHALSVSSLAGPVNATAPNPVRNEEWVHALGRALGRPAVIPVPALALRLMLGPQMAEELLLASTRVATPKLLASGFEFRHPEIGGALQALL